MTWKIFTGNKSKSLILLYFELDKIKIREDIVYLLKKLPKNVPYKAHICQIYFDFIKLKIRWARIKSASSEKILVVEKSIVYSRIPKWGVWQIR